MCGIAGIVVNNSKEYTEHLKKMLSIINHRGPDNEGFLHFDNCLLGHTRLSIIDLFTGNQPMLNNNKNTGITFNGEIYGFDEIKKKIKDYNFKTKSDTEVILALHEKYGTKMLQYLPGAFSFAIWDNNEKQLFCARDRFGEKPFYYALGKNNELIFASEIKSILSTNLVSPELDIDSLVHYLKHLYVHPQKTIYKNIHTIPPAHCLIYKEGNLIIEKYWHLPQTNEKIKFNDAVSQFTELFDKAVNKCMVADVPVGIFLSGGVDSSSIVASASQFSNNVHTFSCGFGEAINELPFAKEIAKKYKTNHVELQVKESNIAELILEMQNIYDEPFADSSNIPTYLISKEAKKYVKVILGGDGGDELLAGYSFWYRRIFKLERALNRKISYFEFMHLIDKFNYKFKLNLPLSNYYEQLKLKKDFKTIQDLYNITNLYFYDSEISSILKNNNSKTEAKKVDSLNDVLFEDIQNYLPGDILTKTDRASLSNSLELRTPFLEINFAEFCISLPLSFKMNTEKDKLIMRKAFADRLTPSILNRRKQGFGAPVEIWLKNKDVVQLKEKFLKNQNSKIYSIFDYKNTMTCYSEDNYKTWILLILSIWFEKQNFSTTND
ncbi:MAG: asparagine synthase (glutamine-hydrolyzing) [Bacteroidales bacterium]|jgi:asparagine synthase (glutamine-hydrolysing)